MGIIKEFEELEPGIKFKDEDFDVRIAINIRTLDKFISGDFDYAFLYIGIDDDNCYTGKFDSLSLDQTIELRDYLNKIIDLRTR